MGQPEWEDIYGDLVSLGLAADSLTSYSAPFTNQVLCQGFHTRYLTEFSQWNTLLPSHSTGRETEAQSSKWMVAHRRPELKLLTLGSLASEELVLCLCG